MAYNTIAELEERYTADEIKELSSLTTGGARDDDVVEQAIADADSEIDGYLSTRYDTPIAASSLPEIVKKLSAVIAYLNLNHRRNIWTEELEAQRAWADKLLKNIASGVMVLAITDTSETGTGRVLIDSEDARGW